MKDRDDQIDAVAVESVGSPALMADGEGRFGTVTESSLSRSSPFTRVKSVQPATAAGERDLGGWQPKDLPTGGPPRRNVISGTRGSATEPGR